VNPGSYCVVNENKNTIYPPELQQFFSARKIGLFAVRIRLPARDFTPGGSRGSNREARRFFTGGPVESKMGD